MNRLAIVALMLCLAATSPCVAGMPTNRFTIDMKGEYLAVSKGQLVFGTSTFGSISDNKEARDRWYVLGTLIKSSVGGGYLAYDLTGESNAVVLKFWPGQGTEWSIAVPSKGLDSEGKKAVIRVAKGPKKGWYLTIAEVEVEKDGRKVFVRRPVLSKDPPEKLCVERIWEHK